MRLKFIYGPEKGIVREVIDAMAVTYINQGLAERVMTHAELADARVAAGLVKPAAKPATKTVKMTRAEYGRHLTKTQPGRKLTPDQILKLTGKRIHFTTIDK